MAQGTYGHKLLELYYTNIALGLKTADAWHDANMFHAAAANFPSQLQSESLYISGVGEYVFVSTRHKMTLFQLMGQ